MRLIIATIVTTTLALTPLFAADSDPAQRLNEAATVFEEIMATPDRGIPRDLVEKAHCIVIVPELKTAAFVFGGKYGKGFISCRNATGADKLLSNEFTLGAEASVVAGPVGRTAAAQTDAQMRADILSWSRSQGLFAGIALEGATLRQDSDDNTVLYGKELDNRDIVGTEMRVPQAAARLIALLNRYSARERTD